jgi:cAMP-specific phosphodiesterase 4
MQGDLEQQKGLPISMLCDRSTTRVAGSQPGFISFVSLPLFTNLAQIMPELNLEVQAMKNNCETWKTYEETEEDK